MNRPVVEDVFNGLLCAVPQGVLLAVIWMAYSMWIALSTRRSFEGTSFNRSRVTRA
jgi:hypothetical protein